MFKLCVSSRVFYFPLVCPCISGGVRYARDGQSSEVHYACHYQCQLAKAIIPVSSFSYHLTTKLNILVSYTVGFTLYCISIIVAVSLITTVPVPPQDNRAWRLFSIPWFFCGCTTSYSSFRGYDFLVIGC